MFDPCGQLTVLIAEVLKLPRPSVCAELVLMSLTEPFVDVVSVTDTLEFAGKPDPDTLTAS
jgi:hypothetical protein